MPVLDPKHLDPKHDDDFDFEPVEGLPAKPPEGETVLWSGSPEKWQLGHQIFRTRVLAAIFLVLAVSSLFSNLYAAPTTGVLAIRALSIVIAGGLVVGFAVSWGWLVAINTVYTITNERIVIRHGVTMPIAINIPFAKVATASAKVRADGFGDISVALLDGNRVSGFAVWPHKRPWSWQGTAPAFKCVANASEVARTLHEALVAHVTASGDVYVGEKPKLQIRTREREGRMGHNPRGLGQPAGAGPLTGGAAAAARQSE